MRTSIILTDHSVSRGFELIRKSGLSMLIFHFFIFPLIFGVLIYLKNKNLDNLTFILISAKFYNYMLILYSVLLATFWFLFNKNSDKLTRKLMSEDVNFKRRSLKFEEKMFSKYKILYLIFTFICILVLFFLVT